MIIHIPHEGSIIPDRIRATFEREPALLDDAHARFLYDPSSAPMKDGLPLSMPVETLVFPVNRVACDVERFADDDREPMAKLGMGVCYEVDANLERFRMVTDEIRGYTMVTWYEPHHRKLAKLVEDELGRFGFSLIVDGHTFAAEPRPYEADKRRPEVCVGYDESAELGRFVAGYLRGLGYDVLENAPFCGSIRPLSQYGNDRVQSVMLEVRQDMANWRMRGDVRSAMALMWQWCLDRFDGRAIS